MSIPQPALHGKASILGEIFRDDIGACLHKLLFIWRERTREIALNIQFGRQLVLDQNRNDHLTLDHRRARKVARIFAYIVGNYSFAGTSRGVAQAGVQRNAVVAQRGAGEMLIEGKKSGQIATKGQPEKCTKAVTLSDVGITRNESAKFQQLAKVPEKKFEKAIETVKQQGVVTEAATKRGTDPGTAFKLSEVGITLYSLLC